MVCQSILLISGFLSVHQVFLGHTNENLISQGPWLDTIYMKLQFFILVNMIFKRWEWYRFQVYRKVFVSKNTWTTGDEKSRLEVAFIFKENIIVTPALSMAMNADWFARACIEIIFNYLHASMR